VVKIFFATEPYMESVPAKADLSIPLSTQISLKYFSDFYISYCRGSLSMAKASGLKATKGFARSHHRFFAKSIHL
jgi:hypothetical protein